MSHSRQCQSQNGRDLQAEAPENLQVRVHPARVPGAEHLIYLPGLHGDWTLIPGLRAALGQRHHFVEMTYPRSLVWNLDNYAAAIESRLAALGTTSGWILAESFGSQVLWALVRRQQFDIRGIILAGGFVKYPSRGLLRVGYRTCSGVSHATLSKLFPIYLAYSRWRHRGCEEALAGAHEFVERRTPADQAAAVHRIQLIDQNDPREVAASTRVMVHALYGWIDPIVPWSPVVRWLRKHCPTLRGEHGVPWCDHNVLATASVESAAKILQWMA